MVRQRLIKMVSLLLCLWYVISLVGFDIHRCGDDGHTYVALLTSDISCSSLHPQTPCHHHGEACCGCCCEDHHDGCDEEEDCCSDEIERILLSGDGSDISISVPIPVFTCISITSACTRGVPPGGRSHVWDVSADPPLSQVDLSELCILRV